jgi:hypothetical protein
MTTEQFKLEKWLWTNQDFDLMGWHDATIYAFALKPEQFELLLDIDYILKWVDPVPPDEHYTFWVAPATLVFEGVQDIRIDLDIRYIQDISLQGVEREGPIASLGNNRISEWMWTLKTNEGIIKFRASGYTQYFRSEPIETDLQGLSLDGRGGLSFETDVEPNGV